MKRLVAGLVVLAVLAAGVGVAGAVDRATIRKPGPLRVVLAGDSITHDYQDEAVAALQARGYQVFALGFPSTGLLDSDQCKGQLAKLMLAQIDPDVVVHQGVGNFMLGPDPKPCKRVTAANFVSRWRRSAALTQRVLTRRGARFLWVLTPTATPEPARTRIPQTNAIYRSLAPTVDAWTAFGGATFNKGLHVADGLHMNQAGQHRLAGLVVAAVTQR